MYTAALKRLQTMDPYARALYIINTIGLVAGTTYGMYYGIFLYRHTFSLSVLAIDGLMGGLGTWLGYMLGVVAVRRQGYNRCIRAAFVLWALVALGTALIANHITEWFILIGVLKALPGGIYSAVADTIMLREVKTCARSGFFKLNLAIEFIGSIILPAVVGAVVRGADGYRWAFVAAAVVYASGLLVRWRLPKPTLSLDLRGLLGTFKRPLYIPHATNRTLATGFNQLNAFGLTIIPFLLLKNEFSMGLLTSMTALLAAGVALLSRRSKSQNSLKFAFGAQGVRNVFSLLFVLSWSAPFMMIWQLVGKLATPLHDPVQQSLDIHNDSLIMGRDMKTRALQINVLNNTLAFIGTSVAFTAFIAITRTDAHHQRYILELLTLAYAAWRIVNLAISAGINAQAQDATAYTPLWQRLAFRISLLTALLHTQRTRLLLAIRP
ncbi:MAG TPA: hypothetical protein VFH39_00690 [Candidatus Saccharimonadales bacterium]|nr:hypothetical protein [Candidatus Saccharimonadales bacterium]